jgi:signal peptidase I
MTAQEAFSLRKKLIENNHSVKIEASGYSMFPFMRNGDVQTISPVPMEDIQIGDVVVYERNNNWISHRVIDIQTTNNETTLTLRGDTSQQIDPPVTKENYIGKTVSFERNGKTIILDEIQNFNRRVVRLGYFRIAFLIGIKRLLFKFKNLKVKISHFTNSFLK